VSKDVSYKGIAIIMLTYDLVVFFVNGAIHLFIFYRHSICSNVYIYYNSFELFKLSITLFIALSITTYVAAITSVSYGKWITNKAARI